MTLLPPDLSLYFTGRGTIARPHSEQRAMAPESSQKRPAALEPVLYSRTVLRAASITSRGMPASGTGTAIHSLRSLRELLRCLRYTRPDPSAAASDTCEDFTRLRLYHQTP